MNNIINNNLALKKEQRGKYVKVKEAYQKINTKYPEFIDRRKMSEKELEAYKRKIRLEIIKDNRRSIHLTIAISLILAIASIIYLSKRYNFF